MRLMTDEQPLHVTSQDIARHVGMDLTISAARQAALASATGQASSQRSRLSFEGGWMRLMAAQVPHLGIFGYKEFHLTADNTVRYCIHIFDMTTGRPLGIVDAALITTLRTAATMAIAVEHLLAGRASVRLGVIGTGAEALAGVRALDHMLDLVEVRATSRSQTNRERFAGAVKDLMSHDVTLWDSAKETLDDVDVAFLATNSGGNVVLRGDDLAQVGVVASIGSTTPEQRELAGDVLAEADTIIVDTLDVLEESGDALEAAQQGLDVGAVTVLGDALRRETSHAVVGRAVYKSIGSPEQDIVLAAQILQAAAEAGFGRRVDPLSQAKVNL